MFDILNKLQSLKDQVHQTRQSLENERLVASTEFIRVEITGLREVKQVTIDAEWLRTADNEEVEDMLVITLNKALRMARDKEEEAMKQAAGGLLPPGFGI